jgi:hypothetical protein
MIAKGLDVAYAAPATVAQQAALARRGTSAPGRSPRSVRPVNGPPTVRVTTGLALGAGLHAGATVGARGEATAWGGRG